jgi:hypothetical protein
LLPHGDAEGYRTLFVRYPGGKFPIEEIRLPSGAAFEEIQTFLQEKLALIAPKAGTSV